MGIAILETDPQTANIIAEIVSEAGRRPFTFTSKDKFLEHIDPKAHRCAFVSEEFTDVIEGTKQVYPSIDIVGIGTSDGAGCIRAGAVHYLRKPFKARDLAQIVEILCADGDARSRDGSPALVVADPSMVRVMEIIRKVAPTQAPVLLMGESGTGKEMVARTIHALSKRREGPYVGINLAALPETLLESELFGYEKGAFTGAYATRVGRFEQANGGTILLDEVTEIGYGLQAKLLRVLQERQIDRVGGKAPIRVDFRVISSTNRDIEDEVRQGRFRHDLFYRLNVIPIRIPPLRERPGDIVPLAEHFISKIALRENIREKTLEPAAKDALLKYPWPGNVREMENVMERAMILADTDTIPKDFIPDGGSAPAGTSMEPPAGITIQEMERRLIHATLKKVGGNRTKAASLLGISIRTLRNKLNEYTRDSQNSDDFPAEEDRAHP